MAANPDRRTALADAAIRVIAEEGARGLTHRAVDRAASVPTGTASNYFPSRDALFAALGDRVFARLAPTSDPLATRPADTATMLDYLRDIWRRLTDDRALTLALLELRLEAARRPALADALRQTLERGFRADVAFNRDRGLPGSEREILLLHLAIDGLVLDQLTVGVGLDEGEVDAVVADLVERVFAEAGTSR